ncbi:MAG: M23 family metallopeptidase [Eubacteriales bacterium]
MKTNIQFNRKKTVNKIKVFFWVIVLNILFIPQYTSVVSTGDNYFQVILNGINIGYVADTEIVDGMLIQARANLAQESDELVFVETTLEVEGEEVYIGQVDKVDTMITAMTEVLRSNVQETLQRSYTVKINEYAVNLQNSDMVNELLQAAIDKYDTENRFETELVLDPSREVNVLTVNVLDTWENIGVETDPLLEAGVEAYLTEVFDAIEPAVEKSFDDFDYGLKALEMGDKVEIVEAYLLESEITEIDVAIDEVTKEQEINVIYEVVSGDTLSQIVEKVNIPMEKIIEINPNIENENSIIRIGDEITVTEPEPELSVEREELVYYEETYDADIIYVDNDDWYTTDQVTLQEPSAGKRNVAVMVTYRNDKEIDRVIEKEEIIVEAVPKIVERGTKIPPTFIKPISGGTISSSFGYRTSPTAGASTYHQGIDWAVPVGTAVSASSGGTVTRAGWASGYGYVVYITHPGGLETRYAHLSKVLVSVGQSVSQGDKIALTGNTGVSTGPHIHFEIRSNGVAVNPLSYF